MKFLNYDSPFMTGFRRIIDYVCLGLLWIIASLPIITFGAATTAMMMTAEISIHKDEGGIFVPFWKSFRAEFKQSTILWLIQMPVLAVLVFDYLLASESEIHYILKLVIYVVVVIILGWTQLWFGYQSKFEDTIKTLLINTFRMTLGNLGRTVMMAFLAVAAVVVSYLAFILIPPALFLIPGIYIMLYMPLLRKLIQKSVSLEEPEAEHSGKELEE